MGELKSESRRDWFQRSEKPTEGELMVGCLQRISDAAEKMAYGYDRLKRDLDNAKELLEIRRERIAYLERSNAALRGHINKMKAKSRK